MIYYNSSLVEENKLTMENFKMVNDALFIIQGGPYSMIDTLYLYTPDNGQPEKVGAILSSLGYGNSETVATELFVKLVSLNSKTKVVLPNNAIVSRKNARHIYKVYVDSHQLNYLENNQLKWNGALSKFMNYNSELNKLQVAADAEKLVRFEYNGGTARGTRIVRLLPGSVGGSGKSTYFRGADLAKSDGDNLRTFRLDKIVGNIEFLN
jgi:hypothetical protein